MLSEVRASHVKGSVVDTSDAPSSRYPGEGANRRYRAFLLHGHLWLGADNILPLFSSPSHLRNVALRGYRTTYSSVDVPEQHPSAVIMANTQGGIEVIDLTGSDSEENEVSGQPHSLSFDN